MLPATRASAPFPRPTNDQESPGSYIAASEHQQASALAVSLTSTARMPCTLVSLFEVVRGNVSSGRK
jgi:hypothetical protein